MEENSASHIIQTRKKLKCVFMQEHDLSCSAQYAKPQIIKCIGCRAQRQNFLSGKKDFATAGLTLKQWLSDELVLKPALPIPSPGFTLEPGLLISFPGFSPLSPIFLFPFTLPFIQNQCSDSRLEINVPISIPSVEFANKSDCLKTH